MKKVICIAALAVLTLASCAKDRTCTCTDTYGGTTTTITRTIVKSTKGQAKANCISMKETEGTDTETIDCKLK